MSADHEQAEKDYLKGMKYKDLAEKYQVSINTIKSWKQRYKWNRKGVHTKQKKGAHKKTGAPYGNKNAKGNSGGTGGPKQNRHAEKHGFFSRIFPDDEETQSILSEIEIKSPLDILWENIVIQYTAIARAQKIMYVRDKEDLTEYLKRERRGRNPEKEWELQFAWDKHANFLQAQSRAIKTLESLIEKYEKLLLKDLEAEEQQLRIETLKVQLEKIKDPNPDADLTSYLEALKATAEETWEDESVADEEDDEEGEADE